MATGMLIAAGERLQSLATAGEAAKTTEVDKLTIWVLTDNYYDTNIVDGKNGKRYRVVPGKSIHAEHGLSYYVETVVDGKTSACMFDYGLDAAGVMNNIALLGIDIGNVDLVIQVGATRSIACRNCAITVERPTSVGGSGASCLSCLTSRLRREVSSARSATSTNRSALNGFSMKS